MITKTKKLLIATLFLSLAIFAGIVGVLTLNNPKLNGTINISNEVFEARIERNTEDYFYYQTLSSAFSNAMEGETIELINPVSLNTKIEIDQNISLVSRYVLGKSTNRDITITTSGTGGFSVASSANLSLGKMAGSLSFQSTGITSPFEIDGEVEITGGEFSTSTNNAIFDITASGTLTLKSGIITAQNRAITNNGTLKIEKSPYIEGEIYLATGKYITFENEAWLRPLQISTEVTTGTVKIAQRTNASISFENKIDTSGFEITEDMKKTTYVNKYVTGTGSDLNENGNDLEIILNLDVRDATSDLSYEATTLNDEDIYQVIQYTGSVKNIVIPHYHNNGTNGVRPVRVIYGTGSLNAAFSNKGLTSVLIPDSVKNIGNYVFRSNQLTSVTIPNSVTSIGTSAFQSNKLTSVTIPNSVTSIGANAFSTNPTLTNLVVESDNPNYKSENNYLLSKDGTQLIVYGGAKKAINDIPNGVTSIGDFAFMSKQITSVIIPNNVISIGGSAFSWNGLTSVIIPNKVTTIGMFAFASNQLTSVTIPNSVTSIGENVFEENQLTSVVWNSSVSIPANAFSDPYLEGKNKITSFTITSTSRVALSNINAFSGVTVANKMTVYVSSNLLTSYQTATNWSTLYSNGGANSKVNFVAI